MLVILPLLSLVLLSIVLGQRFGCWRNRFANLVQLGILQAFSTQNDYLVTFWPVCLVYHVLLSFKRENPVYIFGFVGASLGLAILTESSAYLSGISVGNKYWEYPFWVLLKNQAQIHLENSNVQNIFLLKAQTHSHSKFIPRAIIALRNRNKPQIKDMTFKDRLFTETMSSPPVKLLSQK
jgi:hypothetical protein